MIHKSLSALSLGLLVLVLSGCGEIDGPPRTVEKKISVSDDKTVVKEKTVRENADGSTTKTETKTETK